MENPQHTIGQNVCFEGIGLHTGNPCKAIFKPNGPNTGVTFVRTDLPGHPAIRAVYSNVLGVRRGTTLGDERMRIHTIEHMLSAVYALDLDNLMIEIDANEPPVADGSSAGFFDTLQEAGRVPQEAPRLICRPLHRIEYQSGDSSLTLEPAEELRLTTVILFNHPIIQRQEVTIPINPDAYRREMAPARTFCFDYEVEALKKQGLGKGGSLDNAVVIGLDRIHNKEQKLRFENEFARHKALDLLGDLFLLGQPLRGHITAIRPGHGHNINFVKRLAEQCIPSLPPDERNAYVS